MRLSTLAPAVLSASLLLSAQAPKLTESSDAITLQMPAYELTASKVGGAMKVSRGPVTILETGPANFSFDNGKANPTKLASHQLENGALKLIYDTTENGATLIVELRPQADTVRVVTSLVGGNGSLVPTLAWILETAGYWYGGGFQGGRQPQVIPLNKASIKPRWFLADGVSQGTPAWYTTKGVGLWFRNPVDLHYSVNGPGTAGMFAVEMPEASSVAYDILIGRNIREVVDRINRTIGLPKTVPPAAYFRDPIYTTWVEHKVPVSQEKVIEYAKAIRANKLPAGLIEVDDKWEGHYGDMDFDLTKFPDPKAMTAELHKMGFKVTLWMHTFVNIDSKTYNDPKMRPLLMADSTGAPGLIKWWNGPAAAVWDFTNPKAAEEYRARLKKLQELGFDGFKFDGGDVHLVPRDLKPFRPIYRAEYPDAYNREAAAHFPWEETRVGVLSQPLGVVQRLQDKDSIWGKENGLAAIVPEAITVSARGFFYVMPDMVGGNQYGDDKIDKEMMVRWAQASALMPLMQFSYGPWHFDEETVRLCREASDLHITFAPYIVQLAQAATKTGEPILRPIWYNNPDDPAAFPITDEFMLGTDVLVAPVMEKGATERAIYIPKGDWVDYKTKAAVPGDQLLKHYSAPLDTLPIFVKDRSQFAR
jgi:myogenesis-regulating glycosidase